MKTTIEIIEEGDLEWCKELLDLLMIPVTTTRVNEKYYQYMNNMVELIKARIKFLKSEP